MPNNASANPKSEFPHSELKNGEVKSPFNS